MPIVFRSALSSSIANATFLDKTIDDLKKGKLSLFKVDVSELTYIDDVQQSIYDNIQDIASNVTDIATNAADIGFLDADLATLDGEAIKNTPNNFDQYTEKLAPVEGDILLINDSEDSGNIKKVDLANLIGGGGGAGSSIDWIDGDIAPGNEYSNGLALRTFEEASTQEMFFSLTVPESYTPGDQLKLAYAKIIGGGFSEEYNLVTTTFLLDDTDFTNRTNFHDSTNAAVTGGLNTILNVNDIDLTDGSGLINAVSVAPFDTILVRLRRDSVSLDNIKFIENSPIIKLK